ncbi:rhodaneselike domain containing protein, partial [Acanthamoeba castellanii str. Neff]
VQQTTPSTASASGLRRRCHEGGSAAAAAVAGGHVAGHGAWPLPHHPRIRVRRGGAVLAGGRKALPRLHTAHLDGRGAPQAHAHRVWLCAPAAPPPRRIPRVRPHRHSPGVRGNSGPGASRAGGVQHCGGAHVVSKGTEGASPSDIGVRLGYEVEMAAMGQPLQQHLVGELEKLQEEEEEELQLGQISPDALKEQLDAYTVVDVREREEYEREHVAGAINLPLGRLLSMAATDLAGLLALLPRQQVVVYCRQGYRGALAQKELHPLGVSRIVYNLQGGWEGWNAAA